MEVRTQTHVFIKSDSAAGISAT